MSKRSLSMLFSRFSKRQLIGAVVLLSAMSIPAFADTVTTDPVGFCPPPATVSACTTGSGFGGETISVGTTSFGMEKNGSGTSSVPWYLLVAIPNYVGAAPTITSSSFTLSGTPVNEGKFLPTTAGSIYTFAGGLTGDSSMNASNMFCDGSSYPCTKSNEISAFGSLPGYFEIFEYTFNPGIVSWTPYSFTVGGSGLGAGTFLAASGGSNPFSTPYTVTGLVGGPKVPTPEPGTLLSLSLGLVVFVLLRRRTFTSAAAQI